MPAYPFPTNWEQDTAFIQDAVKYKVRQTWGVKVIDYRGLYKSTG